MSNRTSVSCNGRRHGYEPFPLPEVTEAGIEAFLVKAEGVLSRFGAPEKSVRPAIGDFHGQPAFDGAPTPRGYAEAALADEVRQVATAIPSSRNNRLNTAALKLGQLIGAGWLDRARVERCLEDAAHANGLAADDGIESVRATIRSGLDAGMREPREPPGQRKQRSYGPADKGKAKQHDGGGPNSPPTTEDALALAFARAHADTLRYVAAWSKWLRWDGTRWACDETLAVFDLVRRQCRAAREALPADASEKLRAILSRASTIAAVERLAKSDRRLAAPVDQWDRDPDLLNTPAGLIDLRTGAPRPHDAREYCTKMTVVAPDFSAGRQLWTRFLDEATLGDRGLQRFLQQVAGYCLTGDVREHALFFLYGPGGNGKSLFVNVLAGLMGDYATTAAMDTFTASVNDKHPTDLAMLQGARMVSASETEEGRAWAESRIKQMTGGDTIRARFMRCDFFEYRPQFKLVLIGNHKPVLRNVDEAARRRFNIIPFIHKPPEPDRQLEQKLQREWPAILAWAIEGALDWQRNGLVRPAVVADATNEYFSEQDLVQQWVEECCETGGRSICGRQDGSLPYQSSPAPSVEDHTSSPEAWTCRLPTSGEMIAIVRTAAEATQVSGMLAFSLAEVAVAIEALGETALEAKRVFPGATVTAVRNGSRESTGQPMSKNQDAKRNPAVPKAKPLAPSGSYQSLTKKMPKDTRYKGESFPASDVEARYYEHMAKLRAGENQP